ncbi:MAG: 3-phosphoshikimate 1-carboxyvinyltransferase [Planctomycetes bacterium]|nr:3-phosphoshikimate 1-carboxyvinyltransferase [Planctomycetota bacterium]
MTASADSRPVPTLPWPCELGLELPGSKSEANRVLVAAALSGRRVRVVGATPCDDVRHLVAGLAALGFAATFVDEARGIVEVGPRGTAAPGSATLHCGNAGTALRFLVSVAAITPGEWTIDGNAQMRRRPIGPLVAAWRALGADVADAGGCPPVRVRGACHVGGAVALDPSISSQFVSSLLLSGSALPRGLELTFTAPLASAEYAQLTVDVLRRFGVAAGLRPGGACAAPGTGGPPAEVEVGGDWSAMGVWTCLRLLTGSAVAGTNLRANSGQADERAEGLLQSLAGDGERTLDVGPIPDQFLNLAVVAALRPGLTRLTGAANLRHKECDRVAVMARELRRVGACVEERPDGLVVHGGEPLHGATIDPEHDHRVAMAFALLGLVVPGVAVREPDCVQKSYPAFWDHVDRARRSLRCVAVVGMRGAGKSTFARALAAAAGVTVVDADDEFVARHGPIADFVAAHGWPRFRALEAAIVARSLAPGRVVSTGGGAVEDPATRALLRTHTLTVWLDAPTALLRERLAGDATRPSLTGAPVLDELAAVHAHRAPLYAEVATARIDAAASLTAQVERALQLLGAARPPLHPGQPPARP